MNLNDYGPVPNTENLPGLPARVTAVHRERYEIVCRHESEPGCAIRAAIGSGQLDISRWESYQKLAEEAVDRDEMLRRKREWSKGVAKFNKQRKKEIW